MAIELLTRHHCPLCDEGLQRAKAAARLSLTRLTVTDIDSDADLAVTYALRIPVVRSMDGEVLSEGRILVGPLTRVIWRRRLEGAIGQPTKRKL